MQKRGTSFITLFLLAFFLAHADIVDDYAPGRSGEALKGTLCRHCRPSSQVDVARLDEYLSLIYDSGNGIALDCFTGSPLHDPDFASTTLIVPSEWMKAVPGYHAEASIDLHNMLITEAATAIDRGQLPLGDRMGNYSCVTPPAEMKGDVARAIFYVAAIYPCEIWGSWGRGIFDNTAYPTLRKEWSDMYMLWHNDDPVDATEIARDNLRAGIQGNNNPFVTHPELADYLWGEKAGEIYRPTDNPENPENPENPDNPDNRPTPLRKSYDSNDTYIYLYSPYVPENATWTIDGKSVKERVSVSSLGIGNHELRYASERIKGKLIIEIKP